MSAPPTRFNPPPIKTGRSPNFSAKKVLRTIAAVAVALGGIFLLAEITHPAGMDYIEYWSSGTLLVHHVNPYSPAGVFALEKANGFLPASPLIMLNPPWALFLVAALGFGNLHTGLFLWTLAALGCVLISIRLLNIPSGNSTLALIFAPVLASICSGQSSPFLLLGFSLFLYFHRSRPFLAGASLLLMAIKPHLFLIFWALLLVDCIYRRKYLILAGGLSALAAATAFAMSIDAHIWQSYYTMFHGYKLQQGFVPTASMLFRMLIDVRAFWLLFVPSAVAIPWALWYYARNRRVWDWRIHGMLLMLVTILVSPYGFFSDEIVLLPSIAFAFAFAEKRRFSAWILLAINTAALFLVLVNHAELSSRAYLWTPVTWLAWFLYATHGSPRHSRDSQAQSNALTVAGSI